MRFRKGTINDAAMLIEKRIDNCHVILYWDSAQQAYYLDLDLRGADMDLFARMASVIGVKFSLNGQTWPGPLAPTRKTWVLFDAFFANFPASDAMFARAWQSAYDTRQLLTEPTQEQAMELLGHADEQARAYALEHIAEWRKKWREIDDEFAFANRPSPGQVE